MRETGRYSTWRWLGGLPLSLAVSLLFGGEPSHLPTTAGASPPTEEPLDLNLPDGEGILLDLCEGRVRLRSADGSRTLEVVGSTLRSHDGDKAREGYRARIWAGHTPASLEEADRLAKMTRDRQLVEVALQETRRRQAGLEARVAALNADDPAAAPLREQLSLLQDRVAEAKTRLSALREELVGLWGAVITARDGAAVVESTEAHRVAIVGVRDGKLSAETTGGHALHATAIKLLLPGLRPVPASGPPRPETGWEDRFARAYALRDGETLRWVRPPFIPERQVHLVRLRYDSAPNPPPPDYVCFRQETEPRLWVIGMQPATLGAVMKDAIGLRDDQVAGPEELRRLVLEGDWVARPGASAAEKLAVLERDIEATLRRRIRFDRRPVSYAGAPSEVWTIRDADSPDAPTTQPAP